MNREFAVDLLGLESGNFTLDELKKKYRKLALQKHPDKNGNTKESCEEFRLIYDAYVYLKNESEAFDNGDIDTDTDAESRADESPPKETHPYCVFFDTTPRSDSSA